jgi:quinol monooxygenase YgiN
MLTPTSPPYMISLSLSYTNGDTTKQYTSKSAFDAHVAGEPFQNLSKNAKEWLEGAPVISLSTEF